MSLINDKKLQVEKLRRKADLNALGFRTTKSLEKLNGLIGQERAAEIVLSCCRGYRFPEPIRLAHLRVNELRVQYS